MEEPRPSRREKIKRHIKNNLLTYLLVAGVALGIIVGIIIRTLKDAPLSDRQSEYLGFPGEVLIRLLKCIAIPLIVTCLIVAIGSLDLTVSKTMGWQIIVIVFSTKFVSSTIGVVVTVLIKPGKGSVTDDEDAVKMAEREVEIADVFLDMFRNLIPENMIRLYIDAYETQIIPLKNDTNNLDGANFTVERISTINLLGLIFIATLVGLCLTILQKEGRTFLLVSSEVYEVTMKLAIWVLWTAPVALFFLIMAEILKIKDFGSYFATWGMYIVTLHVGYLVLFLVMHPLLLVGFTRVNPFKFYGNVSRAIITGYATASSVASMPIMISSLENHGLDARLVGFVVPILANTNKDGTACFLAVAAVFIAQMQNVALSFGQYVTIIVLSTMGSIATAGVPFSAVVVLLMVINALALNQQPIGGIMSVEWLNDRGQTCVNVAGNCVIAKILAKWNKRFLEDNVTPNTAESST